MNTLFINYEFPPVGGGAGTVTQNIARELAGRGARVVVLTVWFPGLPEQEERDGYVIIRVKAWRKKQEGSNPIEMLAFVLASIVRAPSVIREYRIQSVLAFFAIPSGLAAYVIRRRTGIPYVVSLQGGDVPGFMSKQLKYYHAVTKPLFRLVCRQSSGILAVSSYLKKVAHRTLPESTYPISVARNGVQTDIFAPDSSLQKTGPQTLLFVGRFSKEKRLEMLLRSFATILEKLPGQKLILKLVGDGPLRPSLEQMVRTLRVENRVLFTGWLKGEKLRRAYQTADVFILPSKEESLSCVVLEAMACGLPIIANRNGGVLEIAEHNRNAILFDETEQSLTSAMLTLIQNPERCSQFGVASRMMSQQHSWKHAALLYLSVLEKSTNSSH